jgi:hypothetical protein
MDPVARLPNSLRIARHGQHRRRPFRAMTTSHSGSNFFQPAE